MLGERLQQRPLPESFATQPAQGYAKGEVIFSRGTARTSPILYGVVDGLVALERKRMREPFIHTVARPGEVFPLDDIGEEKFSSTARVLSGSQIARVILDPLTDAPWVFEAMRERIVDHQELTTLFRSGNSCQRVAYALAELSQDEIVNLPQYTIAARAGLTRENTQKTIKEFTIQGLITKQKRPPRGNQPLRLNNLSALLSLGEIS